jgi:putative mRNA 3-end processing factor
MINMDLKFLGGAREVGKSSILLKTGKEKFVLDHGIEVQEGKNPIEPPKDIDGVFITHAHLDHSGFVPGLYSRGYQGRTFATPVTFDVSHMLFEDSIKVQKKRGMIPGFSSQDIKRMGKKEKIMSFGDIHEIGSSSVELRSAGHIPGAASVIIESRGTKAMYTGDIKFISTDFMFGADTDIRDVDVLISESTYSYKNHPDRKKLKEQMVSIIEQTCHKGGVTVLPAFAVGRTQELLLMLKDIQFPVYVDGMGIRAGQRMLSHPKSFLNPRKLEQAYRNATLVRRNPDREQAIKEASVIITTSGMLNGGPVAFYISKLAKRKDCSMILSGFQVDGTAGRNLLDTGIYDNGEINVKPEFPIHFFDLSAHTDRDHLIEFYKKLNPGKIVLVHGDRTVEFAEELKGMGFDAVAPANGDSIKI